MTFTHIGFIADGVAITVRTRRFSGVIKVTWIAIAIAIAIAIICGGGCVVRASIDIKGSFIDIRLDISKRCSRVYCLNKLGLTATEETQ
jgi:hypothetical protein